MEFGDRLERLLCRCGVHHYAPDRKAGYPYQTCENCDKMGIYRPTVASTLASYGSGRLLSR